MSPREEQCNKVCRILDDVLANRPTERDALIVATRRAFDALSEPHWIPCSERLPEKEGYYLITKTCLGVIGVDARYYYAERDSGYWSQYKNGTVIAWMPLPEPFKGGDGW